MKLIVGLGFLASVVNVFINHANDPAFWGWLSSASWSAALLISELLDS